MKKLLLSLAVTIISATSFGQIKTTGVVTILSDQNVKLDLDNATTTATMTINGPSDRWFAIGFGSFSKPGAMSAGNDVVYFNGTTLIDAAQNGQGTTPSIDAINNWTLVSNTVNQGQRTIIATRPFVGGTNDYTFVYNNPSINLAGSHANSAIMTPLQYHGGNRNNFGTANFSVLGIDGKEIKTFSIYPNPTFESFKIQTETKINSITVYDNLGKTVQKFDKASDNYDISKLPKGIYFIEITSSTNKKQYEKLIKK